MKPKLQVLIAEPSDIIREGLGALLDEEEFVMQAPLRELPSDFPQRLGRLQPDILILNPTLLNTPPRMQLVSITVVQLSSAALFPVACDFAKWKVFIIFATLKTKKAREIA